MGSHAWGFDIDETITAAPKQYANIAKALRDAGDTIHVITGHGPADLRAQLLDLLGFEYDILAIIDPGEDGQGKADYCATHDIYMMFENNTAFGPAISAVCPVTFQYHGPPPEPNGTANLPGIRSRHEIRIVDGPHAGNTVIVTGLTTIVTIGGHDYRIDGGHAHLIAV